MIELHEQTSVNSAVEQAANRIYKLIDQKIQAGGIFMMALAGGNTPRPLYKRLTEPPYNRILPWEKTHLFWGDERFVPTNSPDSNYNMAKKELLRKSAVPAGNIHRVDTSQPTPEDAALKYENEIKKVFGLEPESEEIPSFDLVLLGMGPDGHTASLFPYTPQLNEKDSLVTTSLPTAMDPNVPRVTMTLPLINNAKNVMFLISGEEKRKIFEEILHNPKESKARYPAAMIRPKGSLIWFVY